MRGCIIKRGSRWAVVYDLARDENGRRRRRWKGGFATKREATAALTEIASRLQRGEYVEPSKQTLGVYLREWLIGRQATIRPSTLASYRMNVESHLAPALGSVPLQALTAATLNAFYSDMLADGRKHGRGGLSARTVRYTHMILRRALSDAVRQQLLVRNVADSASPPRPRATAAMKTWSGPELRAFLDSTVSERFYAAFLLAATTGMRRGEVLGLHWRDLDLDAGRAAVTQTLIAVRGELMFSTPKTAKGRRLVALDAFTVAALREHRRSQLVERLSLGPDYQDRDLVFCQENGEPVHPDRFSDLFDRMVKAAGLPRVRFHDLRHTHATLALAAGVHPKVVSERLGHATVSITLDTYSHALPAMQEEAAERVAALVFA
jgi:integrase